MSFNGFRIQLTRVYFEVKNFISDKILRDFILLESAGIAM